MAEAKQHRQSVLLLHQYPAAQRVVRQICCGRRCTTSHAQSHRIGTGGASVSQQGHERLHYAMPQQLFAPAPVAGEVGQSLHGKGLYRL
jgi:hypothetical protein